MAINVTFSSFLKKFYNEISINSTQIIKSAIDTIVTTTSNMEETACKLSNNISEKTAYQKAYGIALQIKSFATTIFIALGATILLCVNPIIFPVSLATGFALDVAFKNFHPVLKTIQNKALSQPPQLKFLIGAACIYTPIAPLAVFSCFCGLLLGAELSQKTPITPPETSLNLKESNL